MAYLEVFLRLLLGLLIFFSVWLFCTLLFIFILFIHFFLKKNVFYLFIFDCCPILSLSPTVLHPIPLPLCFQECSLPPAAPPPSLRPQVSPRLSTSSPTDFRPSRPLLHMCTMGLGPTHVYFWLVAQTLRSP